MTVDSDSLGARALTPNRVVAYNLARARSIRGLTQEQAAELLEPHIGTRWSKATFSAAERSLVSERVREFTADDLVAFARAFDLPVTWFLMPVPADSTGGITYTLGRDLGDGTATGDLPAAFLDVLFGAPGDKNARALITKRITEALQNSEGQRTQGQIQAADLASRVAGRVMEESLEHLTTWADDLRELAGFIDWVRSQTRDELRQISGNAKKARQVKGGEDR